MLHVLCVVRGIVLWFNDTATTEIATYWHNLSLHDALPICRTADSLAVSRGLCQNFVGIRRTSDSARTAFRHGRHEHARHASSRSEEHTSELQSQMRI